MANYTTDSDLTDVRPNILTLKGSNDWTHLHTEAKRQIDQILETRWYLHQADEYGVDYEDTPYDADLVDTTQIRRLAIYKVLQLAYEYLMKDVPNDDVYYRAMKHFGERFDDELQQILTVGVKYDWDSSGTVDEDEKNLPSYRTLRRQ